MKILTRKKTVFAHFITLIVSLMLSACSIANNASIHIPASDTQRLITDNLSFTTERFYHAYMSKSVEQRRLAEMYLIGVIDASEGKTWCNYQVASPSAIQEQAFLGLKHTLKQAPQTRASTAILSRIEQLLPCKEDK